MMGQDPNDPSNVQLYEQQHEAGQQQHQQPRPQAQQEPDRGELPSSSMAQPGTEYRHTSHAQYMTQHQHQQQQSYPQQQYPEAQSWDPQHHEHASHPHHQQQPQRSYPATISEHGQSRFDTSPQSIPQQQAQYSPTAATETHHHQHRSHHFAQYPPHARQAQPEQYRSESLPRSMSATASATTSLSPTYTTSEQGEYDARSRQMSPTSMGMSSQWRPRAASAPSPAAPPPLVPMFGERLQQRAAMQNVPHIPNIVVEPVAPRDPFGHSRTPPFVQSDWTGSQWGLSVPSSSKKMRTNSDSAIYEAEKEQQQQQLGSQTSSYIPTSWEMLAFRQSQSSENLAPSTVSHEEHIRSGDSSTSRTSVPPHTAAAGSQEQLPHATYHPQPHHHVQHQSRQPHLSTYRSPQHITTQTISETVAMETDTSQAAMGPDVASQEDEPMEALNLKYNPNISSDEPTASAMSPATARSESSASDISKPTVPFIWKFQSPKCGQSPKMHWLRRHSDSTLPTEPEDLSVPKSTSPPRSLSTGDSYTKTSSITEEPLPETVTSGDTGIESGGATGSSTSGAEGGDIPSPREHSGDLLSKRLKLKKYLQKRYQLSLESTLSRHSTESDDVFSPSPGIFGVSQGFSFSPTLVEGEISPRPTRPSPLASSSQPSSSIPARASRTLTEPLEIKTEPISPVSSESEGEAETGVFLSPSSFTSPQSTSSPQSRGTVFQFHSPTSFRSTGSDHSTDSSHRQDPEFSTSRGTTSLRRSSSTEMLTEGPHVFTCEPSHIPMETSSVSHTSVPTSPTEPRTMEILRQGRLPPLASMLSHPSFTHPNMPSFSAPQTPPFMTYQSSSTSHGRGQHAGRGSPTSWGTGSTSTASTSSSTPATPARARSASDSDKPVDPSKIIYCPFSEKVQEQRYQREMTFLCPVCGQMFPSYNYLANHMVNHLPSEVVTKGPGDSNKVHLCKVCNRSFSRSDMLTRHMRLHTGLRPYECRMCGQVFSRSDHLHTHLRTHTGEKPYRCPQCPYAAPRRDMITRHMRIHTKHFSRRGRRTSSTGSADTQQSSSFSSLESGDSDLKKRNQSLSSVGSEGSTDISPFRRGSGTSSEATEAELGRSRQWSVTSGESMESSADYPVSTPSSKYSRTWSLTSIESVDVPLSGSPPSGQSTPPVASTSTPSSSCSSSATLFPTLHRAHRTLSATSAESGGTDESRHTPTTVDLPSDSAARASATSDPGDTDIQSSFQKCQVTSDKDSSGSDMSPEDTKPPLPPSGQSGHQS